MKDGDGGLSFPFLPGLRPLLTFPQFSPFFPPLSQNDLIVLNLVPLASWIFFFCFLPLP